MFLAIDVGNTQTTLGLLEGGEVRRRWRLKTDRNDTADELHARLLSFLAVRGLALDAIEVAAIASVVPILTDMWRIALEDALGSEPYVVRGSRDCCMSIDMPYPEQVGADRIANAVEARDTYGAPAIVVDFGTATNIDVVDGRGAYIGGAIAPGIRISMDALTARAAKLASVPLEAPDHAIGRNTLECVQAGAVMGAAAMAEGLVARIRAELPGGAGARVIATGGLAGIVAGCTDLFDAVDQQLTLKGIQIIWQRMQG